MLVRVPRFRHAKACRNRGRGNVMVDTCKDRGHAHHQWHHDVRVCLRPLELRRLRFAQLLLEVGDHLSDAQYPHTQKRVTVKIMKN